MYLCKELVRYIYSFNLQYLFAAIILYIKKNIPIYNYNASQLITQHMAQNGNELMDPNSGILFVFPSLLPNLLQEVSTSGLLIQQLQTHFPDLDDTKKSQAEELIRQRLESNVDIKTYTLDQDTSVLLTLMYGDMYLVALDLAMTGLFSIDAPRGESNDFSTYLHSPSHRVFFRVHEFDRKQTEFTVKLHQLGLKLGDRNEPLQNETRRDDRSYKTFTVSLSDWYCDCDQYHSFYKPDLVMVPYKELVARCGVLAEKEHKEGIHNIQDDGITNENDVNNHNVKMTDDIRNIKTANNDEIAQLETISQTSPYSLIPPFSPLHFISPDSLHISPLPICPHLLSLLISLVMHIGAKR